MHFNFHFKICYSMKMLLIIAVTALVAQVSGHGAMWEPPNRSSMWRFGFDNPPNYNDNENYCGGMGVQWSQNNGQCGACGDNFQTAQPRPNENTGTYGKGTIVRNYKKGQDIDVTIHLSAAHKGWFEFSICNIDKLSTKYETENCFQIVPLANGAQRFEGVDAPTDYNIKLRLPSDLTCKQCSLRWHYRTGNTYGDCGDGTSALGCGPQETFRNCADISIA